MQNALHCKSFRNPHVSGAGRSPEFSVMQTAATPRNALRRDIVHFRDASFRIFEVKVADRALSVVDLGNRRNWMTIVITEPPARLIFLFIIWAQWTLKSLKSRVCFRSVLSHAWTITRDMLLGYCCFYCDSASIINKTEIFVVQKLGVCYVSFLIIEISVITALFWLLWTSK